MPQWHHVVPIRTRLAKLHLFEGGDRISAANGYKQEGLVPFVVDAVYALAYALRALHEDKCSDQEGVCSDMLPIPGPDLLYNIRNASFIGMLSDTCLML